VYESWLELSVGTWTVIFLWPRTFFAVYVIRIQCAASTLTPVFALLPNKRRETYEELFDVVLNKINGLHIPLEVEHIMTDFEDTVLRAIQGVFDGGVQQHGCFYHLTQELGLTNLYREDDNFKLFVGMLDGLAFLPVNHVPAGMQLLRNRSRRLGQLFRHYVRVWSLSTKTG